MEENKDKTNPSTFDSLHIFNMIRISKCLDNNSLSDTDSQVFLCGKMYEHTTHAKYSFKACEFLVYIPLINKIFHSDMKSDKCFTNTLKWNYNFFKKIRLSLTADDGCLSKSTYFCVNYGNEINTIEGNELLPNENSNMSGEVFNDIQTEIDKKIYFELHYIVDNQDITAFQLQLNHIIDDNPYLLLVNRLLHYDKLEGRKLQEKQNCLYEKEKEISQMENEILRQEESFRQRREDYMIKFHLLNVEKNKKISELNFKLNKK